eukprot:2407906-Rhodomonas_salina.1
MRKRVCQEVEVEVALTLKALGRGEMECVRGRMESARLGPARRGGGAGLAGDELRLAVVEPGQDAAEEEQEPAGDGADDDEDRGLRRVAVLGELGGRRGLEPDVVDDHRPDLERRDLGLQVLGREQPPHHALRPVQHPHQRLHQHT